MASFSQADLTPEEKQSLTDIRRTKAKIIEEIEAIKAEMAAVNAELESIDHEAVQDVVGGGPASSKALSLGRKKFNMDGEKGVDFLVDQGLLQRTPESVAEFLYKGEGLNKSAVGDYLGLKSEFNIRVLGAFVDLHDFADLILVQALRQFLWSFRLPGEAQKIDRMMEAFSRRYVELNPGVFSSADACYVVSFAIIMLNTALHNPAVNPRDRTTQDEFVHRLRGIDGGKDLPKELLESFYASIRTEPFKFPQDDGGDLMHTFFDPDREGWLWKLGSGSVMTGNRWNRRWFILNDRCLYYFEFTTDKEPKGIIPLENLQVTSIEERGGKEKEGYCLELASTAGPNGLIKACKQDSEGRVVEGRHNVYRLAAPTPQDRDAWIKAIRESISLTPRIQQALKVRYSAGAKPVPHAPDAADATDPHAHVSHLSQTSLGGGGVSSASSQAQGGPIALGPPQV